VTESRSGRTVRVPRPVWGAGTVTLTATVLLLAAACATPPPPGAATAATSGAPGPSSLPPTGARRSSPGRLRRLPRQPLATSRSGRPVLRALPQRQRNLGSGSAQ